MNKRLHRVVFNAARGLRVVVQETARGAPGGRGDGRGGARGGGTCGGADRRSAPNVPGNLRPTVLVAPNNVPIVNIQTP